MMHPRKCGFESGTRQLAVVVASALSMAALMIPSPAHAGALDDFTRNVTQSVSDAARRGVDSVSNGISSAVGKAAAPATEPAPAPGAAPVPAGVPASGPCYSTKFVDPVIHVTDTCSYPIWVLWKSNQEKICKQTDIDPGRFRPIPAKIGIFGVCRSRTNITAAAGRCECAAGDEVQR
jgi:hypothetical protein